jgi:uncharacterized protein YjbJ (UPF0337 family)
MIPNQDQVSGKWKEIKGELRKTWGEITDDEFERTKGDIESISGLIQKKYGTTKENFNRKLNDIFSSLKEQRSDAAGKIKTTLRH